MRNDVAPVLDTIVNTLLQIGKKVIEVSRDEIICAAWNRKGVQRLSDRHLVGKSLSDITEHGLNRCTDRVAECFKNGESICFEHTERTDEGTDTFNIRIMPIHPDNDKLFLVLEPLRNQTGKALEIVTPVNAD